MGSLSIRIETRAILQGGELTGQGGEKGYRICFAFRLGTTYKLREFANGGRCRCSRSNGEISSHVLDAG